MHPTVDVDLPTVFGLTLAQLDHIAQLSTDALPPTFIAQGLDLASQCFQHLATALSRAGDSEGAAPFLAHAALLSQTSPTAQALPLLRDTNAVARRLAAERLPSLFGRLHS